MAGRDITEGRGARSIAVVLGIGTGTTWQNTGNEYDVAIGGVPFLLGVNDQHPYERATTPFRKQQFDSQRDPGEQSLTTWWLRSQSSFHAGEGIDYYDPLANPYSTTLASNSYRYNNSLGVDTLSTPGQVTLLHRAKLAQTPTAGNSIVGVLVSGADKILLHDGGTLKITDGTTSAMTTISAGVSTTIYASCTDGQKAYYIDAAHIVSVALTGGSTSAVRNVSSVTTAAIGYVKQRLIVGINNVIYEIPTTGGGGALPTATYTHPNTSWVWTSITESGGAIYAAGYVGHNSAIFKFTLDTTTGAMPVLAYGVTAAQMPEGEIIYATYVHLMAYMAIGTNKGVRIASIDNLTGNLTYGPLIIHTDNPVRDFTARNGTIYCATSLSHTDEGEAYAGTYAIDLSNEIDNLRYAYSTHVYSEDVQGEATGICFLGTSNRIAFLAATASATVKPLSTLGLFVESATELYPSGWVQTGYIRYNTLEPKNFKRIYAHGDYTYGSLTLASRALDKTLYDIMTYDAVIGTPESTITMPIGAQDALGLRFTLYRDATDNSKSPVFTGYQLKAVPASPRSRIIKVPLLCYDVETDKYNSTLGYEGRAYDRLAALEDIEATGDVVTWQDFRTGETQQCLIEEVLFTSITPPDKKLTGFGGIISLTIRTV